MAGEGVLDLRLEKRGCRAIVFLADSRVPVCSSARLSTFSTKDGVDGSFLLDQGRPAEAVPFLEKAVGVAGKSAVCHEKLGRALEESGKALDGSGSWKLPSDSIRRI